ncbi:MAG: hypothetical protein HC769_12960 [Cyanobacteria bacterium CRU_2_1]|nr:hypothetical protein [Cyanobacteria bacterium CRU_2_1]
MANESTIKLVICFNDPDLEPEERDAEVQKLLNQLREMDEVNTNRVLDPNPPAGNKALGGFLVGLLMAEVNMENTRRLFSFLGDRLGGKPIELEVEANGRKLRVSAHSREELEVAIKAAEDFITQ